MKLRDMFVSEEQLATDSLIREVIEEEWLKEAHGERAEKQGHEEIDPRAHARHEKFKSSADPSVGDFADEPDDFGDEPEDFGDKDVSYISGDDDSEEGEEFRGAPADPMMSPEKGFEDEPDASTFSSEPVFGDIPEPSADPDDPLWHGNIGWDDDETGSSGAEHRTDVSFPDYEGPKHRSYDPTDRPDEKGFYPRSKASRAKKSRR